MRILAGLLITIAAFSFALGITLPLLELARLFFLTDRPSLLTIVTQLFAAGDFALGFLIGTVSLILPGIKLLALSAMISAKNLNAKWGHRASMALSVISKWSMLDVMLVALAVFAAKTSGLATAISQPGLWFFALSTLASAIAASIVKRELEENNRRLIKSGGD